MLDSVVTDIPHAKVEAVTDRVVREFQLAADKVAAHHMSPARYPMPADRASTEQLLAQRFARLSDVLRKQAADRLSADLRTTTVRAERLGDLRKVDLRSPAPVGAQLSRLPWPARLRFPAAELSKVPTSLLPEVYEAAPAAKDAAPAAKNGAPAASEGRPRRLELRIHRVEAVDTTGEWGRDDIHLGGTGSDEHGDTYRIARFKVHGFHAGDVLTYVPPRQFHRFSLTDATACFPRSYFVTVVLAEADWAGFADYLNRLLDAVRARLVEALRSATGEALPLGGPVGVLIGIAVGAAVNRVFDYLADRWGDEVFKPVTVRATLPSPTARWGGESPVSGPRTLEYGGFGGKYRVVYDWRLCD
ncbi:hypothetical protein [Streptomyces sp. NBC_01304]|uniref:hypothetical protein n=1 Tax=Streptomyces sp. NBC_01304 TaxID=2903818 RepID=UPI002E154FD1|nr:hypothetical protein OG430_35920 [Streptomyces sp. NBC_01304]